MSQSLFALRWNNHQTHILSAIDGLLQSESLVDITLVCEEVSVRAHKVVLSASSPLFQRIISENPCKHPIIVLKDYTAWELQTLVDFMYKGEVKIMRDELSRLLRAAESLQIRGLIGEDLLGLDAYTNSIINQTPSTSPNDYDRPFSGAVTMRKPAGSSSPYSPTSNVQDAPVKLPHMSRLSFPEALMPRMDCQSPVPRRKQARPRRRSGELSAPQDLTTTNSMKQPNSPLSEEKAENLCMKKKNENKTKEERKSCSPEVSMRSPELDLSGQSGGKEFSSTPVSAPQPTIRLKQEIDNGQAAMTFPPMPTVSALAMTPPHSKFFGLDAPLGLFPASLESCRNPLFDMTESTAFLGSIPKSAVDSPMFVKKKMGRPKGQHSAPRGGPPRSWTNNELTQALQHVWNKKMTTSQASRVFGIPYNSLLMYVRGKYGKSLKLEQLRKDCIEGGPNQPMDILGNMNSNNNNNLSKNNDREQESLQNTRPSSTDQDQPPPQHPLFNPYHNFYPDFGTGFPIPVSMIHLIPPSDEKNRPQHPYGQTASHEDVEMKSNLKKEMEDESGQQDIYRPPNLNSDDRRELVHQNGQD